MRAGGFTDRCDQPYSRPMHMAEGRGIEPLSGVHPDTTVFRTACQPFSGTFRKWRRVRDSNSRRCNPLRVSSAMPSASRPTLRTWYPRRESNPQGFLLLVSKTSAYANTATRAHPKHLVGPERFELSGAFLRPLLRRLCLPFHHGPKNTTPTRLEWVSYEAGKSKALL